MKYASAIGSGVVGIGVVLWLFLGGIQPEALRPVGEMMTEESEGEEEEPRGSHAWRLMRLQDPATGAIPEGIRRRELEVARSIPTRAALGKTAGIALVGDWMPRGPVNLGGRTRALAVDQSNSQVLLAGGVSGGMWRSENGGGNWNKVTRPDQVHSVTSIAQDTRPGKEHIWYFGTGEGAGNTAGVFGDGLFKSVDGGLSWSHLSSTSTDPDQLFSSAFSIVWRVATDPSNLEEDEVYAATSQGIFRSVDGGLSWEQTLDPDGIYTDVTIAASGVVYATLSRDQEDSSVNGVWRSEDGIHWTAITPSAWPNRYHRAVLGIAPADEDVVYVLAWAPYQSACVSNQACYMLWRYTHQDGSGPDASWEDLSAHLSFNEPNGIRRTFTAHGNYNMVVAVKPDDEQAVYVGGIDLWRSADGFATDQQIERLMGHHADQHVVMFDASDPNKVYVGSDGGIHRLAHDFERQSPYERPPWVALNHGYRTSQFYTVAVDHGHPGDPSVIGGTQDNGTRMTITRDEEEPWSNLEGGDGAYCAIVKETGHIYASSQWGRIYRHRVDQEGNLLLASRSRVYPGDKDPFNIFINPFVLDPTDANVMYLGGGERLWRQRRLDAIQDGSHGVPSGWEQIGPQANDAITALAPSTAAPAKRLYYGTRTQRVYRMDDADADQPQVVDITAANFPPGYVSSVAVDPSNGDRVLVTFSNYNVQSIFYSEDAGASWTDVSGNLEENPDGTGSGPAVNWIEMLPQDDGAFLYLIATSTGVYSTEHLDGSNTMWMQEGAEVIGNVAVDMLDVRASDGFVVAGTHGNGIYSAWYKLAPPLVVTPVIDALEVFATISFEWEEAVGAESYHLQVATDTAFQQVVFEERALQDTQHSLAFDANVRYYWRVRSSLGATSSVWSPTRSFSTGISTAIDHTGEVPESYALHQNYPNPFNPSTTIAFEMPRSESVTLTVYDMQGRVVETLVDDFISAGRHEVVWDASRYASGTYLYAFQTPSFRQTRTLALVK